MQPLHNTVYHSVFQTVKQFQSLVLNSFWRGTSRYAAVGYYSTQKERQCHLTPVVQYCSNITMLCNLLLSLHCNTLWMNAVHMCSLSFTWKRNLLHVLKRTSFDWKFESSPLYGVGCRECLLYKFPFITWWKTGLCAWTVMSITFVLYLVFPSIKIISLLQILGVPISFNIYLSDKLSEPKS